MVLLVSVSRFGKGALSEISNAACLMQFKVVLGFFPMVFLVSISKFGQVAPSKISTGACLMQLEGAHSPDT